jgi:glucokinase
MSEKRYLGIEIGGSKLQIVLGDGRGHILKRFKYVVDQAAGAEGIRQRIAGTIKEIDTEKIDWIGVGYGGPVDRLHGRVIVSHHVTGWSGFPLAEWLSDLAGVPTIIDNDCNVAALGESQLGAGRGFKNIFYITLGSGVGGGLIIDGEIYHGAFSGETEFGHLRLDKTGRIVESSCSGWAVDRKIRETVSTQSEGILARLVKQGGPPATHLKEALRLDDATAARILDETCDDLAFAISHVVQLIHPELIVLGGGLSLAGEPLRALVAQKVPNYVMSVFQPGPPIRLSSLQTDAVPAGALLLAAMSNSSTH